MLDSRSISRLALTLVHLVLSLCRWRRDLSRLVFLGIKDRFVHFAFCSGSSDERKARKFATKMREGLKRERNQAKAYRVSISSGSLSLIRSLALGRFVDRLSQVRSGASLHTLSSCARSLSLKDERKKGNENEKKASPSPGNLFLRFVGCWGLLAQAVFEMVRGQGLVETRNRKKRE